MDLNSVIDVLKKKGIEFDDSEVREIYDILTNTYCLSNDDAAKCILNSYLKPVTKPVTPSSTAKIADINQPNVWVNVVGTVTAIYPSSHPRMIQSGLIKDDTGTIRFVIWNNSGTEPVELHKTYEFNNVVTSEYNGRFSIGVTNGSEIRQVEGVSYLNGSENENTTSRLVKINEIENDGEWVDLKCKVVRILENSNHAISQQGFVADETGSIRFVIWAKTGLQPLKEGHVYHIKNAVVNKFNDRFSIYLNSMSEYTEIDEVIDTDRANMFTGAIVKVLQGSGLINRCPDCNRVLQKNTCVTHGKITKPVKDYRIKLVLDNGLDYRELVLDRNVAYATTGISFDDAVKFVAETLSNDTIITMIEEKLLGRYMTAMGREIDKTFIVTSLQPVTLKDFANMMGVSV